jgi:hypothetical protein
LRFESNADDADNPQIFADGNLCTVFMLKNSKQFAQWVAFSVVVAFVVLSLAYSVVNPLHEATDELRHYRFVRHLVQYRALPVQGAMPCSEQGHHPPLYYALGALATAVVDTGRDVCYEPPLNPFWAYRYWEVGRDNKNQYLHGLDETFPWRGEALAAHLARAMNVLLGAAAVWLTWLIGVAIWPERPALALGGMAFIAFNPMFLYMAGAINNDVVAALAGAAVTLACVRLLRDEAGLSLRWGIVLGLLYGLALLSKFNLAAILVTIEAVVTFVAWRRKQWRLWVQVNLLIALVSALLAGWWFVRNQLLYGEPTGFERLTELWGVRDPADNFWLAVSELPYAWTSLWGRFGYGQIPMPFIFYWLLGIVTAVGLLGLLVPVLRRRWDELRGVAAPLALLALNSLIFFGVIFNYLLVSPAGPMGRFFFPALPSLSILLFYGLSRWLDSGGVSYAKNAKSQRQEELANFATLREPISLLAVVTNLGMLGLSLVALFGYLLPAYGRPPTFDDGASLPNPTNIRFDTLVSLTGYRFHPETVQPGEAIEIDLYWEVTGKPPGDYLLFVHLIDGNGLMIAQRDTHPGLGNFPSSQWQPGDRFVESLRLYVPETAYTPAQGRTMIGFYAPDGYRLGVTDGRDGSGLGDAYTLGMVNLEPAGGGEPGLPNPLEQIFENKIRLAGYEYSQQLLAPGEPLTITLYWEALQPIDEDYLVQLRLLDDSGSVVANLEERPLGGGRPTISWQPGERIADSHTLILDPLLAGNHYVVQLALEEAGTERRLNLVGEDGRWLDNRLYLSRVAIQAQ